MKIIVQLFITAQLLFISAIAAGLDDLVRVSPEIPSIAFFWSTPNDTVRTIEQCADWTIRTSANSLAERQPVAPFNFFAIPESMMPQHVTIEGDIGQTYSWKAALPVGTKFFLAMSDNSGLSGGSVGTYEIVRGSASCDIRTAVDKSVVLTVDPPDNPCANISLQITGGAPPFTVSVTTPESGLFANVTGVGERSFMLDNVVSGGQSFSLYVTDANGVTSAVTKIMDSGLNSPTCAQPNGGSTTSPSESQNAVPEPSNTPVIVGASVGGALGLFLILGLIAFIAKRRVKAATAAAAVANAQEAGSDYYLHDGNAPLVTPFIMTTADEKKAAPMQLPHSDQSHDLGSSQYSGTYVTDSSVDQLAQKLPYSHQPAL